MQSNVRKFTTVKFLKTVHCQKKDKDLTTPNSTKID